MDVFAAINKNKLLEILGRRPLSFDNNPIVTRILIWDGRIIQATKKRKVAPSEEVCYSGPHRFDPIIPFVEKLLSARQPFIISTGSDDTLCLLEWSIHDIK
jgi:hypothetical protein